MGKFDVIFLVGWLLFKIERYRVIGKKLFFFIFSVGDAEAEAVDRRGVDWVDVGLFGWNTFFIFDCLVWVGSVVFLFLNRSFSSLELEGGVVGGEKFLFIVVFFRFRRFTFLAGGGVVGFCCFLLGFLVLWCLSLLVLSCGLERVRSLSFDCSFFWFIRAAWFFS